MSFIKKHKWTLITLCSLVVLWAVLQAAGTLIGRYETSLWEQLPTLRNHAEVLAIEAKVESLRSIGAFFNKFSAYLIYFFMALPLLSLVFKLDWWLTLAYYLLAHLCTFIIVGRDMFIGFFRWSGRMVLKGYILWAIFALVLYLRKRQEEKNNAV